MDRKQIFPGQIPLETDLLGTNKNVMIALGKLSAAVFGTASCVNGLTVGPNSPAALNVVVQPGELYSLQNIDGTAYSSIAADTTHQIVKQGILLDVTTLSTPAPATAGFSINYLIQAAFSEVDTDAVVLPYYNASNPTQAYSGPANAGTTNNTTRKDTIILSAKAGITATTGTQTTPAADAGYIGLYVVTVANGQTTVTALNIAQLATAPIIPAGIIPATQSGAYAYALDTGTANTYQAAYSPAITAVTDGMVLKFKAKTANTGASTFSPNGMTAQPIVGGAHNALQGGEIIANGDVWVQWNSSIGGGSWILIDSSGGAQQIPPASYSSGKFTAQNFVPSGSTIPANGMYLPGTNQLGFSTNSTNALSIDSLGHSQLSAAAGVGQHVIQSAGAESATVLAVQGSAMSFGTAVFYAVNGGSASGAATGIAIQKNSTTSRSINAAGTLNASGADYAEYMRKASSCGIVAKGQIVGITKDGEITDKWGDSISFAVKSTNPSYVGGDTWAADVGEKPQGPTIPDFSADASESEHQLAMETYDAKLAAYDAALKAFESEFEAVRQTVDRIAFCGQVPINVLGASVGDYIVPNKDGDRIKGVPVSMPTLAQYMQAVGRVIAIEPDGRARIIVKVA